MNSLTVMFFNIQAVRGCTWYSILSCEYIIIDLFILLWRSIQVFPGFCRFFLLLQIIFWGIFLYVSSVACVRVFLGHNTENGDSGLCISSLADSQLFVLLKEF